MEHEDKNKTKEKENKTKVGEKEEDYKLKNNTNYTNHTNYTKVMKEEDKNITKKEKNETKEEGKEEKKEENLKEKKEKNNTNNTSEEKEEKEDKKKNKTEEKEKEEEKEEEKKKNETEEDNKEKEKGKPKKPKKIPRSEALLFGFEKYVFNKKKNQISFNILFVPVYQKIQAKKVKITLKIKYKSLLRNLQENESEIECKNVDFKNRFAKYSCSLKVEKKEIENIEVGENFEFEGQKVDIKECSPMAVKYMKNLQSVGKEEISKKKLYVLESTNKSENKKGFNIVGKITDKNFDYDSVVLTILSSDKTTEKNVDCTIEKKRNKYTLFCKPKDDVEGDLDGATGILEKEDNIIINFKKGIDNSIKFKKAKPAKPAKKETKKEDATKKVEKEKTETENKVEETQEIEKSSGISLKLIAIYMVIGIIIILVLVLLCMYICRSKSHGRKLDDNISLDEVRIGSQ